MDINTLKNTLAEPHVLTRPIIDADRGVPVSRATIGNLTIEVGQPFRPTLYWLGRNSKLLDPVWEYDVENRWNQTRTTTEPNPVDKVIDSRELDPYIMPISKLNEREEGARLEELVEAVKAQNAIAAKKLLHRWVSDVPHDSGAALVAAKTLLDLKGIAVKVVEAAPVEVEEDGPTVTPVEALRAALDADDYHGIGSALKALGHDVPRGKDDRNALAALVLEEG